MEKNDFPSGLICKAGNVDFVKARLSFVVEDFIKTLQENQKNGWVNIDVLESKEGKIYSKFNTWEPEAKNEAPQATEEIKDDLPF
jgi:hypothetical protein